MEDFIQGAVNLQSFGVASALIAAGFLAGYIKGRFSRKADMMLQSFSIVIEDALGRQMIGVASGEVLRMIRDRNKDEYGDWNGGRKVSFDLVAETSPVKIVLTDTTPEGAIHE